MKKFAALTALALFAAAPALAETQFSSRDGEKFSYSLSELAGVTTIDGRSLTTGKRFVLRVRNSRVAGTYNGRWVSFPLKRAAATEIAAR